MEDLGISFISGHDFAFLASKGFACGFLIGFSINMLSIFRRSVKAIFTSSFPG